MHRLRDAGYEVASIGKLHFQSSMNDNGFSDEIVPMHIADGKGDIRSLLRGYGAAAPSSKTALWDLYFKQSGVGESHYQEYDQQITQNAISWLDEKANGHDRPWALFVSYVSPHPPFVVPKRFYDLYPLDRVPLPSRFSPQERSTHPASQYHREISGTPDIDEQEVRKITASYLALISFTDEQIGCVLDRAISHTLLNNTNVIYTSDHGEMYGTHGLLGKSNLYEDAVAVPLIMSGPMIPNGGRVSQLTSHVDLYPTIIEACGLPVLNDEREYAGKSLWPALRGFEGRSMCFAEYHAKYSKNGSYMIRDGAWKLIYHVGMPSQLFNLEEDPTEAHDLAIMPEFQAVLAALDEKLRVVCEPEQVDMSAKAAQRSVGEVYGGVNKLVKAPNIKFTPPPGVPLDAV